MKKDLGTSNYFRVREQGLQLATKGGYDSEFFDNQISTDERLLTKQEIADFLNVSIKMIDRKVSLNEIPYLKIGRLVRFNKRKVLRWAEEHS